MMRDELLTLPEVASFLRLSNSTVYKLVHHFDLPAMKIANQWRFKSDQVDEWVSERLKLSVKVPF